MQVYSVKLELPPNTPKTNPVKKKISLKKGYLWWTWIFFPDGCAGLAHVRVFLDRKQIIPEKNPGDAEDSIALNGTTIWLPLNNQIENNNTELKIEGWNEDDTYPHTISLIFQTLDENEVF